MAIKKKNKEVLLNQAKGFFEHEVSVGRITEERKEEIFGILSENDFDISDKEQIKEQLKGTLDPDEFEELYGKYITHNKISYKTARKRLKKINLFPVKYSFLNNEFINLLLTDNSIESYIEEFERISSDDIDTLVSIVKTNIEYFETFLDKKEIGKLDVRFFITEYPDDLKKIIEQLGVRGINDVDNYNKLVNIITSSDADNSIKNMKMLRDVFGIDSADDFAKLTDLISYCEHDQIEKTLKKLKDDFGINDADDFAKLTDLISYGDPDQIEKKMTMLRDEFGFHKADDFAKLIDLFKYGDLDQIEKKMKILRDEFGFHKADDFAKLSLLINYLNYDRILENMKILRDELGFHEADDFAKLIDLINHYNSDKIKENIKMLRDEFGFHKADDFAKLTGLVSYGDLDKICKNIKILRDEFELHDASVLAKLTHIICYGDSVIIGKNMKILKDEFEFHDADDFDKLTGIINHGNPDKIGKNMKILKDEFGFHKADDFAKFANLINEGNPDNIKRNIEIFRNEFGISGIDNFAKFADLIKNLNFPIPLEFKEENHKGYLKFLNEIVETNYKSNKKCKMVEKVITLTFEQAENYVEVFKMLDDSISMDIQRIKNELIDELLKTNNPKDIAQQIINIFEKNNLPLTGKIFKVFELLYPKEKFKDTLKPHGSPVLHQYLNEGKNVYDLIYRDLMNIAIKSGDRSLRDYINIFVGSEELLRKFEDIVSVEGFDGNNTHCLDKKLEEDEQAKLLYLFRRISVLYNRYYGGEIKEGNTIENKDLEIGESTVSDNQLVELYNNIRKGFRLKNGESIYDRLQRFLWGLGYHSFNEVLKDMNEWKKQAHERGLNLYNEAMKNGRKISFPKGAFLKGVKEDAFSKIINRGITSREYLGGGDDGKDSWGGGTGAGSDATPFDIDGLYVDTPRDWTSYGSINLIIDTKRCDIVNTRDKGLNGYKEKQYELFVTGGGDHYGIRTGIPTTEVDYIIFNGSFDRTSEIKVPTDEHPDGEYIKVLSIFQNMCYEIARNGYYIPIVDNEGNIKFTPEMYNQIRAGFNYMQYYDGFDVEQVDGKWVPKESDNKLSKEYTGNNDKINPDGLNTLIADNSPSNEKYTRFAKENRELAENTIKLIKKILIKQCGIKFNSKHDSSITGAELHDSGSTGRGTDIPTKDVDLDFTLLLDGKDYDEKLELIKETIYAEIGTGTDPEDKKGEGPRTGGFQMKSKKNKIGERPDGIPLDLLILKKSQVIEYSSSDAMKEKLKFIKDKYGDDDLDRVRTNVIIMKKLLKSQSCYKKTSAEGGIAGIGVENWITQHNGSFIEALESFEKVAYKGEYKPGNQPISLERFKELYPIYDAGENYKDGCNDNFVEKINEHGYNGMLKIVIALRMKGIQGIEELIKKYEEDKAKHINK